MHYFHNLTLVLSIIILRYMCSLLNWWMNYVFQCRSPLTRYGWQEHFSAISSRWLRWLWPSLVDQSSSTPAVQIQVLQQGQGGNTNTLAMQALLAGQDLSSTQLALANLPANKQQEVLVAAQQQLLQNLRSSLPPGQPIVVPQNVAMVSTPNLTNRL